MKTINIKGKEYVTVNERLKEFRTNEIYKGFSLETELINLDQDTVTMRAVIRDASGLIKATGFAQEVKSNPLSMVNKTSYVENCETSAWGRALGNLGIGIDSSVASAEEVVNAVAKKFIGQEPKPKTRREQVLAALENSDATNENVVEFIKARHESGKLDDLTEKEFKELLNEINKRQIISEVEL